MMTSAIRRLAVAGLWILFKNSGQFQVPPDQYEANLRTIVERIRSQTQARVLFATTTPIVDERAAATRAQAEYALLESSVEQYNAIAQRVMRELAVPLDDLHAVFPDAASRRQTLGPDGVHFTAAAQSALAKAVAAAVAEHLPAAGSKPSCSDRLKGASRVRTAQRWPEPDHESGPSEVS